MPYIDKGVHAQQSTAMFTICIRENLPSIHLFYCIRIVFYSIVFHMFINSAQHRIISSLEKSLKTCILNGCNSKTTRCFLKLKYKEVNICRPLHIIKLNTYTFVPPPPPPPPPPQSGSIREEFGQNVGKIREKGQNFYISYLFD